MTPPRLLIAMICLLLYGNTYADVINVPADYPTIQGAVDAASDGDEIVVAPGTYTSTQDGHVVNMKSKAIMLRSSNGPEVTIIDGEAEHRGIYLPFTSASPSTIDGFTITNCSDTGGGSGVYCNSNTYILNCLIKGNTASGENANGGGLLCGPQSNVYLANCIITENIAGRYGGGVWIGSVEPRFSQCVISDNLALNTAGAIGCLAGYAILNQTTICGNSPNNFGGCEPYDDGTNEIYNNGLPCPIEDNDGDLVPDTDDNCDLYNPDQADCNSNGIGDVCDIDSGQSHDVNISGTPDECECLSDASGDNIVDIDDLLIVIALWGNSEGIGDVNYDGNVNIEDLLKVIDNWGECAS